MSKCRLVKKNNTPSENRGAKARRNCLSRGMNVFCLLIFGLTVASGVYCFGLLNSRAGHSFEIADLESELQQLKEDNKNLTVAVSELQQVARIQEAAIGLGLVATEKAEYLSAKMAGLAQK